MSRFSTPGSPVGTNQHQPQARGGLGSTFVLAVGTFAVGTDAFVVAGFLPEMARDLNESAASAGQSVTVFAFAYAVLAPIVATMTARLPRRRLLVGALLVLGLANLLSALSPNLPILLISRVLAAVGAAAYTPNAGAVGASLVRPELRARALAVVVGGLTVATALGVPLGDLASHWLGWRAALGLVTGLCGATAIGVFFIMPVLPGNPRVPLRTRLSVLRRPGVVAVLPLTLLGMTASYTVYAYSVPALGAVGIAESSVTLMLFLYGVGAVIGNLAAGFFTDQYGAIRVLTVAYLGMSAGLAALAWIAASDASPVILVGFLAAVWGATSWAQTPPQQHRLIAAAPQEVPLVVSLNSSSIYLGIGAGTGLGGVLLSAGFPIMYGAAAVIAVASLVFIRIAGRPRPERKQGVPSGETATPEN